ncbi:glucosyltransferase domain-containing protein [Atopobium fossor]|uniref:glucosyltransferase domain-containing protein n=1 Tax=Atopobium fossor TaxID=39487 RepID=UPI0003F95E2D|nr:glucosyltransferase domain-containing protein [Atopobium fossor]
MHNPKHATIQPTARPSAARDIKRTSSSEQAIFERALNHSNGLLFTAILTTFTLVFFCLLWRNHFSTDSYQLIDYIAPYWHLSLGRYTNFAIFYATDTLGISVILCQRALIPFWILGCAIATYVVTLTFYGLCKPATTKSGELGLKLLLAVVSSLSWLNVFHTDLILFPEVALPTAVGIVTLGFSVKLFFARSIASKLGSVVLLIIALGSYQSFVGIYVTLVLFGSFAQYLAEKDDEAAIKRGITACVSAGIGAVFNIAAVKILLSLNIIGDSGRGADLSPLNILKNLLALIAYQVKLYWNVDGLFAPGALLLFMIVLILCVVRILRGTSRQTKNLFAVTTVLSYLAAFAPHLIESHIFLTPRSNIAVWSFIAGLSLLVLVTWHNEDTLQSNYLLSLPTILKTALMALLILTSLTIQDIVQDVYISNEADRTQALAIGAAIRNYENQSGIQVTQIGLTEDKNPTGFFSEVRYGNYELGARILTVPYSYYYLINYMNGTELTNVSVPAEVNERYFKDRDWDRFNVHEQLVFEGNTAYLCTY